MSSAHKSCAQIGLCYRLFCFGLMPWLLGLSVASSSWAQVVHPKDLVSLAMPCQSVSPQYVLSNLRMGSAVTRYKFTGLRDGIALRQGWAGPTNDQGQVDSSIDICLVLAESANQAALAAQREAGSYAVVFPEITGETCVAKFTDRAWCGFDHKPRAVVRFAHLIFIRGNVAASVVMGQRTGIPVEQVFALAEQLGRRIDAARAGKPEPVAVLPISCDEMHIGLKNAWEPPFHDAMLGKPDNTVVVYDGNGIPRAIPAEKTPDGDTMVPLDALFAVSPGPKTRAKTEGTTVRVTLAGKAIAFTKDQAAAKVGGQAVTLKHPAEVRIYGKVGTRERPIRFDEQTRVVWVPLSVLELATGKPLAWSAEAGRATARF